MSNRVVLFANGKVARLVGKNYTILIPESEDPEYSKYFTVDGKVNKFKVINSSNNDPIEYIYLTKERFYKEHQNVARSGFFPKLKFEQYRNSNSSTNSSALVLLELEFKNGNFKSAEIGDIFEIEKLEFQPNYTAYYKNYLYKFKIQNLYIDFSDSAWYSNIIDSNPNSPTYNIKLDNSHNLLLTHPTGSFYTLNFGDKADTVAENKRKELSRAMTLICFRIGTIFNDNILDRIAITNVQTILVTQDLSTLPQIDQFIGQLLRDWGYASGFYASRILTDLRIEAFESYYNGLVNLHKFFYLRDEDKLFPKDSQGNPVDRFGNPITAQQNNERRIAYLIDILPPESLLVLSYEYKIAYLEKLMKGSITGDDEGRVLAIVFSIAESANLQERENFLDFLLKINDGSSTNFDILFQKLDDKVLAYVAEVISMFFDPEESNRGNFCLAVYKIWTKSKYNFFYIPDGVTPNVDDMNPEAYFFNEGAIYYNEKYPTIYYSDFEERSPGMLTNRLIEVDKELNGFSMKITEVSVELKVNTNPADAKRIPEHSQNLHIYQPISLINYTQDIDFEITAPDDKNIPAFLLYYYEEFTRIKTKFAQYSFAIDLTVEAIVFFLSGGTSLIKNIRYLKYLTYIGKGFKYTGPPTDVIYIWEGLSSTAETFAITASVFMSYQNYAAATAGDQEQREKASQIGTVFVLLTFLGGGLSAITKFKAVQQAKLLKSTPAYLEAPTEVRQLIDKLAGQVATVLDEFRNVKLSGKTNIINRFDVWTDKVKEAFYYDFRYATDADLQRVNNSGVITNWENLNEAKIVEKIVVDIITDQDRVDSILKYYSVLAIRNILEPLERTKRWKFLDGFGNALPETFNRIVQYPRCIDVFYRHSPKGMQNLILNKDLWLKYFEARTLYKNQQWQQLADLFGFNIGASKTFPSLPGQRWLSETWFDEASAQLVSNIISNPNDIFTIAGILNVPQEVVAIAKRNYFEKERFVLMTNPNTGNLEFQIGRYPKTYYPPSEMIPDDQVNEWLDATQGIFQRIDEKGFKYLLAHEYVEGRLIDDYGLSFRSLHSLNEAEPFCKGAHDLAPRDDNGLFVSFERIGGSPPLPNPELTNLDEIVQWFVEFYKL